MSKDNGSAKLDRRAAVLTDQAIIALFGNDDRALKHFVKRANRISRRARRVNRKG